MSDVGCSAPCSWLAVPLSPSSSSIPGWEFGMWTATRISLGLARCIEGLDMEPYGRAVQSLAAGIFSAAQSLLRSDHRGSRIQLFVVRRSGWPVVLSASSGRMELAGRLRSLCCTGLGLLSTARERSTRRHPLLRALLRGHLSGHS